MALLTCRCYLCCQSSYTCVWELEKLLIFFSFWQLLSCQSSRKLMGQRYSNIFIQDLLLTWLLQILLLVQVDIKMLLISLGLVQVLVVFVKSMPIAALYWKVTVLQNLYKQAVETSKAKQKLLRRFGRTPPTYVWKDQVCLLKLNKNIMEITKFAGAQSHWQSCQAASHVLLSMLLLEFLHYKITTFDLQILQTC